MIRGTTWEFEYTIPFGTEQLAEAYVTLTQNDVLVIEKPLAHCNCDGNKLTAKLTQEESLKLTADSCVKIILVVKTVGGDRLETAPTFERVVETSKGCVI